MVASRLIERLDGAITASTEPLQREYLKAERAGALARLGLLADARFALSGLRTQNQRHKDTLLAAWIQLVDGQVDHFDTIAPHAATKFQRALELAESIGHAPMQALASAWLANCAVNSFDLEEVTRYVANTLRLAEADAHSTLARIGLVLADAYCRMGDDGASQTWCMRARAHASAEGDTAMISAMLYNIATRRADQIGLDDAFGRSDPALARRALLEAESTANYDWGSGVSSLSSMVPMVRAQLLVTLGRHAEALYLLDEQLERSLREGLSHREARLLADRAWCCMHTGDTARALADIRDAEAKVDLQRDSDDRAAALARLARIHRGGGRESTAQALQAKAEEALAEYVAGQKQLRAAVEQAFADVRKDSRQVGS